MKTLKRIAGSTTCGVALAWCSLCPTIADAGDGPWRFRVFALSMNPTGNEVVVGGTGERISFDAGGGYGGGLELEYRATRRLGIDFGALTAEPVIDVLIDEVGVISAEATPRITPLYVAFNIHLTPESRADLYVGPMLAYIMYSSFDLVADPWFLSESFVAENDIGIGVNLGLDLQLGKSGWLLSAAFKYIDTTLVASPPDESSGRTDINPMIFSVGFGYRF